MAEPKVFLWSDIGYLVETRPSSDGLLFCAYAMKRRNNVEGVWFEAPSGRLIEDYKRAVPFVTGKTSKSGCVDLLFESTTLHFCSVEQAACIGEMIRRVCRVPIPA